MYNTYSHINCKLGPVTCPPSYHPLFLGGLAFQPLVNLRCVYLVLCMFITSLAVYARRVNTCVLKRGSDWTGIYRTAGCWYRYFLYCDQRSAGFFLSCLLMPVRDGYQRNPNFAIYSGLLEQPGNI